MPTDYEDSPEDGKEESAKELKSAAISWAAKIEASKLAAKEHFDDTRSSWKEYLAGRGEKSPSADASPTSDDDTRYPIFYSSVQNVQPMIYSRTPIPVSEKVFDDLEDNLARLGALSHERIAKYVMRDNPFDRVMQQTRDIFIHSGKTAPRIYCEATFKEEKQKTYYQQAQVTDPATGQPVPIWIDEQGQPLTQDAELIQDEKGYYLEGQTIRLERQKVCLGTVHTEDVLHNPDARSPEELDWIAFGGDFTKSEVAKKFGKEWVDKLSFGKSGKEEEPSPPGEKLVNIPKVRIWEIWEIAEKEVYWFAEGYTDSLIPNPDYQGDPYELIGFYPMPAFMLGTFGPMSIYTVPAYIQVRPLAEQLHGLYRRIRRLVRATRRRGVFDASVEELGSLADVTDEAEWIGVQNFKELIGDGGLEAIVKTLDVKELTDAIKESVAVAEQLEAKFNEIMGIPDIMRGVSDPTETAAAQQQKGKYLALRASTPMQEFQRLVRDVIELMVDLALKKFPDDQLMEVCGVQYWAQEDKAFWPAVLELLRNDKNRQLRIDIETDSTIAMNEAAEIEQRNYIASTMSQIMNAMAQAEQMAPQFKGAIAKTAKVLIGGIRQGKHVEEEVDKAFEEWVNAPPPQAPDDPTLAAKQMDVQAKQQELQFKQMELQVTSQLKAHEQQIAEQKIAADSQTSSYKAQSDAMVAAFQQKLDAVRIQLEAQQHKLDMYEKLLEEARLTREEKRLEEAHQKEMRTPIERPAA